jgi:glutamyl-tRNA reductase
LDKGGLFLLKVSYSDLGSIYFNVLTDLQIDEVYDYIKKNERIEEAVVLWTCNRFEVYFYPGDRETVEYIEYFVKDKVNRYSIIHGWDAVKNLFLVAAGLDSMVIGENEILGQVKDAWDKSRKHNLSGEIINPIFQKAIEIGKKVRRENGFNRLKRSVVSEALELAKLDGNEKILIIGAGKTGTLVSKMLHDKGIPFTVSNRTHERAELLSKQFGARVEEYKSEKWWKYNLIITAVKSHKPIIDANNFAGGNEIRIIDLGVPSNVSKDIKDLVEVIDMDTLSKKIENERKMRKELANRALLTVEEEFKKFSKKMKSEEKVNLLKKIQNYSDIVIKNEMEEMERRINLSAEERIILEKGLVATRNRLLGFVINAIKRTEDIKSSSIVSNMEVIMDENVSRLKTKKAEDIARD